MPNPKNPFIANVERTANLSPSHRRAPKQENEIAKLIKGRKTAASGAKDVKGDVRLRKVVRIECKTTKNKSFSVTLDMIETLEEAAVLTGEMPIFIIEFNDGKGRKLKDIAVCPSYVLDTLIGAD